MWRCGSFFYNLHVILCSFFSRWQCQDRGWYIISSPKRYNYRGRSRASTRIHTKTKISFFQWELGTVKYLCLHLPLLTLLSITWYYHWWDMMVLWEYKCYIMCYITFCYDNIMSYLLYTSINNKMDCLIIKFDTVIVACLKRINHVT